MSIESLLLGLLSVIVIVDFEEMRTRSLICIVKTLVILMEILFRLIFTDEIICVNEVYMIIWRQKFSDITFNTSPILE